MPKIFISYRREDSKHAAGRLVDALTASRSVRTADIFIDVDNIPAGVDFVRHLDSKVSECDAMIALIGPDWLRSGASLTSGRRLDDPTDFVRIELASALKRGIPVAPVLLDGTPMPKENELPDDLKPLARRQAVQLRHESFDADSERLIRRLNFTQVGAKAVSPRARAEYGEGGRGASRVGIVAPVIALALLALAGAGAWLWFADPLGWKTVRSAGATPASPTAVIPDGEPR